MGCLKGEDGRDGWEGEASQVEAPRWGGAGWEVSGPLPGSKRLEGFSSARQERVLELPDGVQGALDGESGRPPKNPGSETSPLPASLSLWVLWV